MNWDTWTSSSLPVVTFAGQIAYYSRLNHELEYAATGDIQCLMSIGIIRYNLKNSIADSSTIHKVESRMGQE
jgi:hypothetical protein